MRPAVVRALERKAVHIVALFHSSIFDTKAAFEAMSSHPPLRESEPRFAGAALWALGLVARVMHDCRVLTSAAAFIGPVRGWADVQADVTRLNSLVVEFTQERFAAWISSLAGLDANNVSACLSTPLLVRCSIVEAMAGPSITPSVTCATRPHLHATHALLCIRSGFDPRLLGLIAEVAAWTSPALEGKFNVPAFATELIASHGEGLR